MASAATTGADRLFHMLVAERQWDWVDPLKQRLRPRLVHAFFAHNGQDALQILASQRIDAAIVGTDLAGGDSLAWIDRVHRTYRHLPVILVSPYPSRRLMEKALRLHAVSVLSRPIDLALLSETLADVFDHGPARM